MKQKRLEQLVERLQQKPRTAAFTGAGVSTLCGVPDFRGPQGLYKNPDAERIFDIDWFHRDPAIYYKGCRELIYGLREIRPGPVHEALVKLEREGVLEGIITQNIDMLHQKAGSATVHEVHGSAILHHCVGCRDRKSFEDICEMLRDADVAYCAKCGKAYKPDITFFGEALPEAAWDAAMRLSADCELMLVLGSSLTVYPAASLPGLALKNNAELAIVNGQDTSLDAHALYHARDLAEFARAILAI